MSTMRVLRLVQRKSGVRWKTKALVYFTALDAAILEQHGQNRIYTHSSDLRWKRREYNIKIIVIETKPVGTHGRDVGTRLSLHKSTIRINLNINTTAIRPTESTDT